MSDDDVVAPLSDSSDNSVFEEHTDTNTYSDTGRSSRRRSTKEDDDLAKLAKVNVKLAERKLKLEELRFKLDERKADHVMLLELKDFDLKQDIINCDRQLLLGSNESWMKSYWRPAAGWIYLAICFMDFIGFPLLVILAPAFGMMLGIDIAYEPWTSITLTEGGLIHLSFGAILGVTAWTRGKEKLAIRGNSNV
jgi:hypothetical protein